MKEWCIFKGANFHPMGIGKVDKSTETEKSVRVIYFEGQTQKEIWVKKYLEMFSTPEEAIEIFSKRTGQPLERVRNIFLINFPEKKERRWLLKNEGQDPFSGINMETAPENTEDAAAVIVGKIPPH